MSKLEELKKTKLQFGNPEHIQLRDEALQEVMLAELKKKVKCPFCKAKPDHIYHFDVDQEEIGWNFDCGDDCPNSLEYAEKHGYDKACTITNFKGKFLDLDEEDYHDDCC